MSERKYSIAEIDQMRNALRWIVIRPNVSYFPQEMDRKIEEMLRTYMLNGTEPAELQKRANEILAADQEFEARRREIKS